MYGPAAGTALAPPTGSTLGRRRPRRARFGEDVTEIRTIVKSIVSIIVTNADAVDAGISDIDSKSLGCDHFHNNREIRYD